jgi:hypothetical protein
MISHIHALFLVKRCHLCCTNCHLTKDNEIDVFTATLHPIYDENIVLLRLKIPTRIILTVGSVEAEHHAGSTEIMPILKAPTHDQQHCLMYRYTSVEVFREKNMITFIMIT